MVNSTDCISEPLKSELFNFAFLNDAPIKFAAVAFKFNKLALLKFTLWNCEFIKILPSKTESDKLEPWKLLFTKLELVKLDLEIL